RVPWDRRSQVEKTLQKLALYPLPSSLSPHRIEQAREEWWSARVDDSLRLIYYEHGNKRIVCWVDHHDDAYRWACTHSFQSNDYNEVYIAPTGEALPEPPPLVKPHESPPTCPLRKYDPAELTRLGVPRDYAERFPHMSQSQIEEVLLYILDKGLIPEETVERFVQLLSGVPLQKLLPPVQLVLDPLEALTHQKNRRRFWKPEDSEALRRMLEKPWEEWLTFLNPTQAEAVEREFSGPARVTGGAGTGKTIVAVYRSAHLALRYPSERILLTTYTRKLARELKRRVEALMGEVPGNLEIINLDAFITRTIGEVVPGRKVIYTEQDFANSSGLHALYDEIRPRVSLSVVQSEWEHVVDAWNVQTLEEYLNIKRIGRRMPLNPQQRRSLFPLFEKMRENLAEHGVCTANQACYLLAEHFKRAGPPFRCVVADESQDFGPAQLTLLKALAPEDKPDHLFFCADTTQRIYRRHTPWLQVGIDVRGRSIHLKVNYRSSAQIQRFGERVLPLILEGVDEIDTQNLVKRPIPCFLGPEPECHPCEDDQSETQRLKEWLRRCLNEGIKGSQIGILARTENIARSLAIPALEDLRLSYSASWEKDHSEEFEVWVGTVHSAKGLEFRAVAVVGVSDDTFPLQKLLTNLNDPSEKQEVLDQERQLLHTAFTRPRERLFISWSGKRSRFLS
ncbi:MAG: UvrD-helicase domain-containing protein, partial [Fimbriimonadales bacterium]|nr:UvrD-helicase domain-containing protein [Fimbriimonadales bacterium]